MRISHRIFLAAQKLRPECGASWRHETTDWHRHKTSIGSEHLRRRTDDDSASCKDRSKTTGTGCAGRACSSAAVWFSSCSTRSSTTPSSACWRCSCSASSFYCTTSTLSRIDIASATLPERSQPPLWLLSAPSISSGTAAVGGDFLPTTLNRVYTSNNV